MVNAFNLKLPNPSSKLIEVVVDLSKKLELPLRLYHGARYSIDKIAFYKFYDDNQIVNNLINTEFSKFFYKHKLIGVYGVMKNLDGVPKSVPPHVDSRRSFGLNFMVDKGGDKVQTIFYDKILPFSGLGDFFSYEDITPAESYIFENQWYCINTSRIHSVENISTTRISICIKLVRMITEGSFDVEYYMEDFIKDYPDLIESKADQIKP